MTTVGYKPTTPGGLYIHATPPGYSHHTPKSKNGYLIHCAKAKTGIIRGTAQLLFAFLYKCARKVEKQGVVSLYCPVAVPSLSHPETIDITTFLQFMGQWDSKIAYTDKKIFFSAV